VFGVLNERQKQVLREIEKTDELRDPCTAATLRKIFCKVSVERPGGNKPQKTLPPADEAGKINPNALLADRTRDIVGRFVSAAEDISSSGATEAARVAKKELSSVLEQASLSRDPLSPGDAHVFTAETMFKMINEFDSFHGRCLNPTNRR
jgi:hypothetical protein